MKIWLAFTEISTSEHFCTVTKRKPAILPLTVILSNTVQSVQNFFACINRTMSVKMRPNLY